MLRGYATGTYPSPGQNRASGQRSGPGRDTVRGQTGDLAVQAQWSNAAAGRQRAVAELGSDSAAWLGDGVAISLDRLEEDRLILAFGRWAEGQIKKWIDYSKGALLFVMVPDDPESGMFCVYDQKHQAFWTVDPVATSNFGGYRLDGFDQLAQRYGLRPCHRMPCLHSLGSMTPRFFATSNLPFVAWPMYMLRRT
jgi:hypothetical protein